MAAPNNNIFQGPFAAFGETITGLRDKINQIQAQRVMNKDAIKNSLAALSRNIDELVNQTNNKLRPLAARNAELTQQVQTQQQQLTNLQQQSANLQQQINGLQGQIQQLTQERQQLQQNLEAATQQAQQVPQLQQQVQELNNSIQQKDQQIQQATQEMNNITGRIGEVNTALAGEIEKLNELIGNRTNEEIVNIIGELQNKLTNIINTFNQTNISGGRRRKTRRNKRKSHKGGYTYPTNKELEKSSIIVSKSSASNKSTKTSKRTTTVTATASGVRSRVSESSKKSVSRKSKK